MGKISEKYKFLKNQNNGRRYLFKRGIFYIFLNEDAEYMSEKLNLKLTTFGHDIKCGFPVNSKERYLSLLTDDDVQVIDSVSKSDKIEKIIKIINKIDLDNITPKQAITVLYNLKGTINE